MGIPLYLLALLLAGVCSAAAAADLYQDITSMLIVAAKEAATLSGTEEFEDDIEDPVPPEVASLLPVVEEFEAASQDPTEDLPGDIPGGDVSSKDAYPGHSIPSVEASSSQQQTALSSLKMSSFPKSTSSARNVHPLENGSASRKVSSEKRATGRMVVLRFGDAKAAFDAALRAPNVPWQLRWFVGTVSRIKEPRDALHSAFLASLLQAGSYALRCAGEFRRLRHFDKGKASGPVEELQALRGKSTFCVMPIKTFLSESRERFSRPFERSGQQKWERAARLLDALLLSTIAMEKNFAALTIYMEARANPKTPNHVLTPLKEQRDKAKAEYEAAKAATKLEAKACEEMGILPKSFPLF